MAKHVLTNAGVKVGGTATDNDISDHVSSVTLEDTADEVEFTSFGAGYREFGQGLKNANITLSVFNDYDANEVDALLAPLYSAGTTFTVRVTPNKGTTVSATNPYFELTGRLYSYSPLAGAVGDANTTDVTINNGGTAGLTRATAGTF